jgi:LysR family transcriptional regulator, hydrogen peroxide-inducible genes activator
MTTVQLEYIVAVDTYRNFVQAAEKSYITQPTLSMQIQKMEDELGVKIFDRTKQPVVPTSIGKKIIEQARIILKENARIKEIIADQKHEIQGELRIGIIPTLAPYLLPQIIPQFLVKYPLVKLDIWEYPTEQIKQQLKSELLDCGLLATPLEDQHLHEIPLFYETFVAYISRTHSLFNKKILLPTDLDINDIWLLNEGHCMRNQVLNLCRERKRYGEHKNFDYNTGSVETLKRLVELNDGFTILPELSIHDFTTSQLEMVRYFKAPEPVREIGLVTQKNFIKHALIEAFRNEILAVIPEKTRIKARKKVLSIN